MGPNIQFASEKNDPVELRIYTGKNGNFEIYEDENDNYNYEKGIYSTIPISWDNAKKQLTIGTRKGNFPGMPKTHTFNVVIVKENHGTGIETGSVFDRTIEYSGKEITVSF